MKLSLTASVTVGDPRAPITVSALLVETISLDFRQTPPRLSVVLADAAGSGYKINLIDSSSGVTTLLTADQVMSLLQADGKLPAGTLSNS